MIEKRQTDRLTRSRSGDARAIKSSLKRQSDGRALGRGMRRREGSEREREEERERERERERKEEMNRCQFKKGVTDRRNKIRSRLKMKRDEHTYDKERERERERERKIKEREIRTHQTKSMKEDHLNSNGVSQLRNVNTVPLLLS